MVAASEAATKPLTGFTRLAESIFFFQAPHASTTDSLSLVVLCTWFDAQPRHIAKYTDGYKDEFPSASILVIKSDLRDMAIRSEATQRQRLAPACEAILRHAGPNVHGSVLLHILSNGGSYMATQLLANIPKLQRDALFRAIIFDSCPGNGSYQRNLGAMLHSLPKNAFARTVGTAVCHVFITSLYFINYLHGVDDVVSVAWRRLNDTTRLNPSVPRLYVYSKTDRLVLSADVQEHAAAARQVGVVSVAEEEFVGSGHCAHLMLDSNRYWRLVRQLVGIQAGEQSKL